MTGALEPLAIRATGAAADAIGRNVPQLVTDRFASRLFAKDASLWGEAAQAEASNRLGWTGLHRSSRPLLGEIAALREELRDEGADHVVLCGMGGSSLAPEVICASAGVELTVLDSSDPSQVAAAVADRLDRTVVVVSSKSGSTVETDSQRRAYVDAFTRAGLDPTRRIVIVTDPGSPLDEQSRADGYRVVNADPEVGGRYSAMTAFGLVPSGLAGADIEGLLDERSRRRGQRRPRKTHLRLGLCILAPQRRVLARDPGRDPLLDGAVQCLLELAFTGNGEVDLEGR